MTGFRTRFQLRRRVIDAYQKRDYGEEEATKAEKIAKKFLEEELGGQGWEFFHGVLIPDPNRPKGQIEIDIIAVSPKGIILIEVKNWKGRIEVSEEKMVQVNGRGEYLLKTVDERIIQVGKILRPSIIQSGVGDDAPPIKAAIILTHRNSESTAEMLGQHKILKVKESTAIKSLFDVEDNINNQTRQHIVEKFEIFGTWDTIQHKGREGLGLIQRGQIPKEKEMIIEGINILDRTKVSGFSIEPECGWFRTLFKTPHLNIKIKMRTNEFIKSEIHIDASIPWIKPGTGMLKDGIPLIGVKHLDYGRESNEDPRIESLEERISFSKGDIVRGTIDNWHNIHGLFVELQPGLSGLIPMSFLPDNFGLDNLKTIYPRGASVRVVVTNVNHERRRIALKFPEGDK